MESRRSTCLPGLCIDFVAVGEAMPAFFDRECFCHFVHLRGDGLKENMDGEEWRGGDRSILGTGSYR